MLQNVPAIFKKHPKFLYIMGGSGCGKTTLATFLDFNDTDHYKRIIQYTSREPRENEVDGVDYFFVSERSFEQLDKDEMFFARVKREFAPSLYGTPISAIDPKKINLVVASMEGLVDAVTNYGAENVYVLLINQVEEFEADRGEKRSAKTEEKYCNIVLDYLVDREPKLKVARIAHEELKIYRNDLEKLNDYFRDSFGKAFI